MRVYPSDKKFKTPEYRAWSNMKTRCSHPQAKDKPYYADRGITVCELWRKSFDAFLADVGPRPSLKHSIDRINNDGNYEPGNVRWATAEQNRRNNRFAHFVEYQGKTWRLQDLAAAHSMNSAVVGTRLKQGRTVQEAITRGRLNRRWQRRIA